MRKFMLMIMTAVCLASLSACGQTAADPGGGGAETGALAGGVTESGSGAAAGDGAAETASGEDGPETPNLKTDGRNVTVVLSAKYFQDMTEDEIKAKGKKEGAGKVAIGEDGSVTYEMTAKKHQELLDRIKKDCDERISNLVGSEQYPGFVGITYEDDLSQFMFSCDQSLFSQYDTLAAQSFMSWGAYRQALTGLDQEMISVQVSFVDKDTGEILAMSIPEGEAGEGQEQTAESE